MAENETTRTGRLLAFLTAAVLLVLAVWSVSFYLNLWVSDVGPDDWSRAASRIEKDFRPGDIVVISPSWLTFGESEFVRRNLPYRQADHPEIEEFPRAERLWIVAAYGRCDFAAMEERTGSPLVMEKVGAFTVALFGTKGFAKGRYILEDHVPEAEVYVTYPNKKHFCPWKPEKNMHLCDENQDWHSVYTRLHPRRGMLRKSIWAHPVQDGDKTIVYHDVKLGSRLVIGYGMTEWAAALDGGGSVTLSFGTETETLESYTMESEPGWHRVSLDTSKFANEIHDLHVVLTTDNQGRRHIFFEAFVTDE